MGKTRKQNMRICCECPMIANEPHRYFPYQKGIVEPAKKQDKHKNEDCFMLTGKNQHKWQQY